jgi:VanZ family protein
MPAVWPGGASSLLFGEIDKWAHGLTFALLAIWFSGQYRRQAYWRIVLGLVAFGLLIELCQRLVGYRSADWLDVAADCGGIGVGMLAAVAGLGAWALHVESLIAGGPARD